jgi:hypothetical protein
MNVGARIIRFEIFEFVERLPPRLMTDVRVKVAQADILSKI